MWLLAPVEPGEGLAEAAEREIREEAGLVAQITAGVELVEYAYSLAEEPAERRRMYEPSVAEVAVTCFHVVAPDDWEPTLDWEHDAHRWCDLAEASNALRWTDTANALTTLLSAKPR